MPRRVERVEMAYPRKWWYYYRTCMDPRHMMCIRRQFVGFSCMGPIHYEGMSGEKAQDMFLRN
jgi:hypothetical protein